MAVFHFILFAALLAAVYSGATHVEEPKFSVKHHGEIMANEISQRLNEGVKRSSTVHHNRKLSALDPTTQPTNQPTILSSRMPTVRPTFSPTNEPTQSPSQSPAPILSPTPSPTALPSTSPAPTKPTAQPTLDPDLSSIGFFFLTNSFKSDCSSPVVSYGVPVDTCFADNSDGYAYVIRIVNADWSNAFIDYYSDKECQQLIESGVPFTQNEVKCQQTSTPVVTNPLKPNGNVYSQLFISTSATPPRISDAGGGLFEFYEGSTTCSATSVNSYLLYTADVCLSRGEAGAFYVDCSTDAASVRMSVDSDGVSDCVGSIYQFVFADGSCDGGLVDDDDDNTIINTPPSVSTTPFPTSDESTEFSQRITCQASQAPTMQPVAFTFKVTKQVINGYSKAQYDSDVELYSLTLRQAIASTMEDVIASDITNLVVTADGAARTAAVSLVGTIRRVLQASSVTVSYTVSGASVRSASYLAAQLQAGLESGNFDTSLHLLALQNGATGLVGASSTSAETDIQEDEKPLLSLGAIIGIAIGGFAFLVLLVAAVVVLVWYCCRRPNDASVSYEVAATGIELPGPVIKN
eukprot:gene12534-14496_t